MNKWIIFRADKRQPGWQERRFQHSQSFTKILAEHFSYGDRDIPEPGYRPPEFLHLPEAANPQYPSANTHWRQSDWEVTRVETYTPDIPIAEFDTIVVCYCTYNPIDAPLKEMPERQISVASFGDNKEAYEHWLEKQEEVKTAEHSLE